MQIHQQATLALKYMVQFRQTGSVEAIADHLCTDNQVAISVMKYLLRRRISWFTTVTAPNGVNTFVITPKHIENVIKFLDNGGFK